MPAPIIQTKLFLPPVRPLLVRRQRLIHLLEEGLTMGRGLTLISAPAGFGKSSLLADWAHSKLQSAAEGETHFSWLALDAEDNLPGRFWIYFLSAIRKSFPDAGEELLPVLTAPVPPGEESQWMREVLSSLINILAGLEKQLILVLDDYHVLTTQEIHQGIAYILDHRPPQLHLVIATRSDPPLPLGQIRARGMLTEIRAADLRFTNEEAASFTNQVMGLGLESEDITSLEANTEGWVAGLQMAALAIKLLPAGKDTESDLKERSRFIQGFSGANRFIIDYLVEQVLNLQPAEVQKFLLETSILERMNAELCDTLETSSSALSILEYLDRSNLFLIPLDDTRTWYRYHHLFADLLQVRLRQTGADRLPILHTRAAEWLEVNGFTEQAIRHGLLANNYGLAGNLILKHWQEFAHSGDISTPLRWLDALPIEIIQANVYLSIACAWILFLTGRLAEFGTFLRSAELLYQQMVESGQSPENDEDDFAAVLPQLLSLRSMLFRLQGRFQEAIEAAEQALPMSVRLEALMAGILNINLGHAYREAGQAAEAINAYEKAIPLLWEGGNPVAVTSATFYLARLHQLQGRLHLAYDVLDSSLKFARAHQVQGLPAYGLIKIGMADILREWDQLKQAGLVLAEGIESGKRGGYIEFIKNRALVSARLKVSEGDPSGALEIIEEAVRKMTEMKTVRAVDELKAMQACLWASLGQIQPAATWAETASRRLKPSTRGYLPDIEALALVKVALAQNRMDEAGSRIESALAGAREDSFVENVIELLICKARYLRFQKREDLAAAVLAEALALGAPEGYQRIFLDQAGEFVSSLESSLRSISVTEKLNLASLTDHIMYARTADREETPLKSHTSGQSTELVEPLSEREIEVLKLLARGFSNRQIAKTLILALGTVKTHIHNIYGKLDVENRVQAIERGRQLKLL